MNQSCIIRDGASRSLPWQFLFLLVLSVGVFIFVPSNRSLWVDEGYTALSALEPSWNEWLEKFPHTFDYDPLKPLPGLVTFLFSRVTGGGEAALRYHNVVWILLGVGSLWFVGQRARMAWLPFVFILHPFVWYYLDEVRPYALQLGAGAMLLLSCLVLTGAKGKSAWGVSLFVVSSFLLSGSSLLGGIPVALAFFLLVALGVWRQPGWRALPWRGMAVFLVSQSLWVGYYLWQMILWRGQEAARQWDASLANVGFSFFEFLGLTGFGPSREILRETIKSEGGAAGILLFQSPWSLALGLLLLLWMGLFFFSAKRILGEVRKGEMSFAVFCIVMVFAVGGFLLFAAIFYHWPFWGRHLAGIFPFFLFIGLYATSEKVMRAGNPVCLLLCILLALASLRWAVDQNPFREDYRTAATMAKQALAEGKVVWWFGSPPVSRYYGIESNSHPALGQGVILGSTGSNNFADFSESPFPDWIFLNRPDVLDPDDKLRRWLSERGFIVNPERVNGFYVFGHPETR